MLQKTARAGGKRGREGEREATLMCADYSILERSHQSHLFLQYIKQALLLGMNISHPLDFSSLDTPKPDLPSQCKDQVFTSLEFISAAEGEKKRKISI